MRLFAKLSTKIYPHTDFVGVAKIGWLVLAEQNKMLFFACSPTCKPTTYFYHSNSDFSALQRATELKIGL